MDVIATTAPPRDTDADTVVVGVFEGKDVAHDLEGAPLQGLLETGEARRSFKHVALTHAEGKRWLLIGLGERDAFDAERARVAAAVAAGRLDALGTRSLCWEVPHHVGADVVEALVEGTLLAAYRFDRYRRPPEDAPARLERLVLSDHHDVGEAAAAGRIIGEAQNAARDLANTPANVMTPTALGERARELAAEHDAVTATVEGRAGIEGRGMGAFAAVARGSDAEPALITLRYEPDGASGPLLGLVGKAVTFDSGGLSIKPAASMVAMKFDMAGGAAVLEAVGAIARLRLPVRVLAVVGATENLINGSAMRPGDILHTKAGLTIEVNNTDAEGRLVLADCLAHAVDEGAERIVDVATLTGAILGALGRTHAGVLGDDDAWCEAVAEAGRRSGEIVWRLPLHPETAELVKGTVGDLVNAVEGRVAGAITAAELLQRFTGEVPWAHLDIVGVAWDSGKPYAPKGASGWGVRILVELARALA